MSSFAQNPSSWRVLAKTIGQLWLVLGIACVPAVLVWLVLNAKGGH